MHTEALIIGSGPAGLAAALYMSLSGFSTIELMGTMPGGQMIYSHQIDNFPGVEHIAGTDLSQILCRQNQVAGTKLIYEQVKSVHFDKKLSVYCESNTTITADTVIIATGTRAKWLGVPGEDPLIGHGISICATCDGVFYRHKTVAVIGGGNSAVYEALFLSKICYRVFLINRSEQLSADPALIQQLNACPNVEQFSLTIVQNFVGERKLDGINLYHLTTKQSYYLAVDGAFEAIGSEPNTALFQNVLDLNDQGYILTDAETLSTSMRGVFACGDVQDEKYHQAIIAAGSGARAALSAKHFLVHQTRKMG